MEPPPPMGMQRPHPLLIPEILREVFRYLPNTLESVARRRLVCRTWRDVSDFQWRRLIPCTLLQDPYSGTFGPRTINICEAVAQVQQFWPIRRPFPYQNFTLSRWNIDHDNYASSSGAASVHKFFWDLFGHHVTTLTLTHCKIPYNFTLIPLALWKVFPKLERLTLKNCEFELKTERNLEARRRMDEMRETVYRNIMGWDLGINPSAQAGALGSALFSRQPPVRSRDNNLLSMLGGGGPLNHRQPSDLHATEQERIMRNIRSDTDTVASTCPSLRSLHVENVTCTNGSKLPMEWSKMMITFPYLERVFVRQENFGENGGSQVTVHRALKELDVMNISTSLAMMPSRTILRLPTEKLSFDCGFCTESVSVRTILDKVANDLKELSLFRAPFGPPYSNFPCGEVMPYLTELHLRGTFARDLNLLQFTPNLKTLRLNTDCYDGKTRGARLYQLIGQRSFLLTAESIVMNTHGLGEDFKLESLQGFEVNSGRFSFNSLARLAKWFPNLTFFKATVVGNRELAQIGWQWINLERLELAHGSNVTAEGILNVRQAYNGFQMLRNFTWEPCPCALRKFGGREMRALNELKRNDGAKVVHPWRIFNENEKQEYLRRYCFQDLFEKALAGEEVDVERFRRALGNAF